MSEPNSRSHPKLKDDDPNRKGYLLNQKAHNYVRKLQLEHALAQRQKGQKVEPLSNVLLVPGEKHPDLTWPVYLGEKGEPIAIYTRGKLGEGSFGGVYVGVNLDTGEPRAVKIQYPKNTTVHATLKEEESVLVTLNRFDDRFETQNMDLAKDYIKNEFFKKLLGVETVLATIGVMQEKELKDLMVNEVPQTLIDKLMANIEEKYPHNFNQFKTDFVSSGGAPFLEQFLGVEKDFFIKNTSSEVFKEILMETEYYQIESLPIFMSSLQDEVNDIGEFMNIGAQELAWGENLQDISDSQEDDEQANKYSVLEKLDIAIQMLQKVDDLHQIRNENAPHGLVHRDLKAANVMYDKLTNTVQIVDMGFTKPMDSDNKLHDVKLLGTPCALAPELITADSPVYSAKTDMYAAGVTLLEFFSKEQVQIPFVKDEENEKGAWEQAMEVKASLDSDPHLSGIPPVLATYATDILADEVDEPLKSLYNQIKKMIDVNPEHRATFAESIESLKKVRVEMLLNQENKAVAKSEATLPFSGVSEPEKTPTDLSGARTQALPRKSSQGLQQQQKNIKNVLDIAITQIADIIKTLQAEQPPRKGARKELLKSLPNPHQKMITEASYWMSQVQALRMQSEISPQNIQKLIANIQSREQNPQKFVNSSTTPQVHQRLQSILTTTQNNLTEHTKPPTDPSKKSGPYRSTG